MPRKMNNSPRKTIEKNNSAIVLFIFTLPYTEDHPKTCFR
jgi:hypothetical protein